MWHFSGKGRKSQTLSGVAWLTRSVTMSPGGKRGHASVDHATLTYKKQRISNIEQGTAEHGSQIPFVNRFFMARLRRDHATRRQG
jgi:hypothetical protein